MVEKAGAALLFFSGAVAQFLRLGAFAIVAGGLRRRAYAHHYDGRGLDDYLEGIRGIALTSAVTRGGTTGSFSKPCSISWFTTSLGGLFLAIDFSPQVTAQAAADLS